MNNGHGSNHSLTVVYHGFTKGDQYPKNLWLLHFYYIINLFMIIFVTKTVTVHRKQNDNVNNITMNEDKYILLIIYLYNILYLDVCTET